jgi:MFS family permease
MRLPASLAAVRPVTVLLLAIFLISGGSGPLTTTLSLRLEGFDLAPIVVGIVMSAYFAGLTLGSLLAARIILRAGHIRAFTALVSVLSATALVYALSPSPVLWGVLRLAEGFCMAGVFICVESWLNDAATPTSRGTILACYMTALYVGQASGQFLLRLDGSETVRPLLVISILMSLAVVPVALTRRVGPQLSDVVSLSVARLFRASPLGTAGTAASGLLLGSLYSLGPAFARAVGFSTADSALFMSAVIFGGVVLQWPLGRLSDGRDRRYVILGSFAAVVVASLVMFAVGRLGHTALLGAGALFGGTTFALYPLCVAQTNDHLDASERVGGSGGLILIYSAAATFGPLLASAAMTAIGPSGLFVFSAVVAALGGAFAAWRMRIRPSLPEDQRGRFQTLPRTTPQKGPLAAAEDITA